MAVPEPVLQIYPQVGDETREWWEKIGQILMAFNALEYTILEWAAHFAGSPELEVDRLGDDLEDLIPMLYRGLAKAGLARCSESVRLEVEAAVEGIEVLRAARGYVAHMRLCFHPVPLPVTEAGTEVEREWAMVASHVEGRTPRAHELTGECHDLPWLRGTALEVTAAARAFQQAMDHLARTLGLEQ